jgi:hypothetical protein
VPAEAPVAPHMTVLHVGPRCYDGVHRPQQTRAQLRRESLSLL